MKIPFLSFSERNKQVKSDILAAFEKFYDSEYYVLGNFTKQFEQEFAQYSQVKHCVGISNGLDALHLALKALNIGQGDEVIVPSNTYIATVLAISFTGATPILVEPYERTFNIDSSKIANAITPATRAIMPVHLYGQPCEMDTIMALAQKHNLFVIEDNAQSQGAAFQGKKTGSFGHLNATSFYPSKNLAALGEAGAITTDSDELAEKIRVLRNYGTHIRYHNDIIGYNNRIDECQAAFLSVHLKKLDEWSTERQKIAKWYNEALAGIEAIDLPITIANASHVYHLYVIKTRHRDNLQKHLADNGIGTLIHYPIPPHLQKAYAHLGYQKGDFPIAEGLADTCLSLPIWVGMSQEQVEYIAENTKRFYTDYFFKKAQNAK